MSLLNRRRCKVCFVICMRIFEILYHLMRQPASSCLCRISLSLHMQLCNNTKCECCAKHCHQEHRSECQSYVKLSMHSSEFRRCIRWRPLSGTAARFPHTFVGRRLSIGIQRNLELAVEIYCLRRTSQASVCRCRDVLSVVLMRIKTPLHNLLPRAITSDSYLRYERIENSHLRIEV